MDLNGLVETAKSIIYTEYGADEILGAYHDGLSLMIETDKGEVELPVFTEKTPENDEALESVVWDFLNTL